MDAANDYASSSLWPGLALVTNAAMLQMRQYDAALQDALTAVELSQGKHAKAFLSQAIALEGASCPCQRFEKQVVLEAAATRSTTDLLALHSLRTHTILNETQPTNKHHTNDTYDVNGMLEGDKTSE